jgi:two-component system LytT family sensor kinase
VIEVEDDGVGMGAAQVVASDGIAGAGIGMANIQERLKVLYGEAAKMMIDGREGGGTLIRLRLPILPHPEELMTTGALSPTPSGKTLRKVE